MPATPAQKKTANAVPAPPKTHADAKPDFTAKYLTAQKTHNLPDFDALNAQFDLDTIDPETKHVPKETAKKIFDQLDVVRKTLESLLQPDASILLMQESEFLSEADHERLAELARRLMRLDRRMLRAELTNNDDDYAEFVRQGAAEWPEIQRELLQVVDKLERGWANKRKGKQTQHYLG